MNVKIIKSKKDYKAAMTRFSILMDKHKFTSEEDSEFDLLALVIGDYERKTIPPVQADPIEAILFRVDQMQLTRKDLEKYIGPASKVSEVLARKRPLSIAMIRRLHKGLGIPADVLIRNIAGNDDHEALMTRSA